MNLPDLNIPAIIGGVTSLAVWVKIRFICKKIIEVAGPMIQAAEQLAIDGLIDKEDRKKIVMVGIEQLEKQGVIRLGLIGRMIISRIVDKFAQKLPDYTLTQEAKQALLQSLPKKQ